MKLGKFFFEVDTNVTCAGRKVGKEDVLSYHFNLKEDFDKRINEIIAEYGIEAIQAIGEYQ